MYSKIKSILGRASQWFIANLSFQNLGYSWRFLVIFPGTMIIAQLRFLGPADPSKVLTVAHITSYHPGENELITSPKYDIIIPHMLHGAGIFTNICPKKWPSFVGKYSSTMEHLGTETQKIGGIFLTNHHFFSGVGQWPCDLPTFYQPVGWKATEEMPVGHSTIVFPWHSQVSPPQMWHYENFLPTNISSFYSHRI